MPSSWVNWADIQRANEPAAERQRMGLLEDQQGKEAAYQQALARYRQDAMGNVSQGGSGQVASYGDAYAALKEAERNRALLQTDEGRRALLAKKQGGRSSDLEAALVGGGGMAASDKWKELSGMLGADSIESFLAPEKKLYAHNQEQMAAQKARNDAALKQRNAKNYEIEAAQKKMRDALTAYETRAYGKRQGPSSGYMWEPSGGPETESTPGSAMAYHKALKDYKKLL